MIFSIINPILSGLQVNITSILISNKFFKWESLKKLIKLILPNFFIYFLQKIVIYYLQKYLEIYLFKITILLINVIFFYFSTIIYIISLDRFNDLLYIIFKNMNQKPNTNTNTNIISKIYNIILNFNIYLFFIIVNFITNFNFNFIYYNYYCLEYICYYKNINNTNKYKLFEQNILFFIGFGVIYYILEKYLNQQLFTAIMLIILPINIINLYINFNKLNYNKNYKIKCFNFIIYFNDIILYFIDYLL